MFGAVHQGHIGIPSEMEVAQRYTLLTPGMDGAVFLAPSGALIAIPTY